VRFLLLTAARRGEAAKLPWIELDIGKGVWLLPASRKKKYFKLGGGTEAIIKEIEKLRSPPPRKRKGAVKYSEAERNALLAAWAEAKQCGWSREQFARKQAKTSDRKVPQILRQLRYFLARKIV
jgi:hypothetical protein